MESRRRGLGNTEQGDTHLMFTKRSEELRKLVAQEEGKASGKAKGSNGPDMYVRSLTEGAEGVCTEGGRGRKEGLFLCDAERSLPTYYRTHSNTVDTWLPRLSVGNLSLDVNVPSSSSCFAK